MNLDLTLFRAINDLAGSSRFLDYVAIFFAEYSQYLWVVVLAGFFDIPSKRLSEHRDMVTLALVAALTARFAIKPLIAFFYARPRPFEALSGVHQLIPLIGGSGYSFPSGHTLFFFAIATVLIRFNRRAGTIAFIAATLMTLSRIYAGVHYPSDVLAGAIIGIVVGLATVALYRRYAAPART